MKEEILSEIGLSRNEAKVYTALLREGSSPATKIMKECQMHRSNVYDALERLTKKGLAGYILKGETKNFEATHPENLSRMLKEKELHLSSIIPVLSMRTKSVKDDVKAHVYEGYKELKRMITHFVDNKTEYLSIGVPPELPKVLKPWLELHHRERIKKGVFIRIIFNEDAEDRAKIVNGMKLAQAKYFPKEFNSPVTTEISGDEIMLIHWAEHPLIVHIECKEIADSYKRYFELLWNIAKLPA